MIEGVECGEAKKDGGCLFELEDGIPKNAEGLFYKVKFEAGKTGYLNALYIFNPILSRNLLAMGPRSYIRNDNIFEINADYNVVWNVVVDSIDELPLGT